MLELSAVDELMPEVIKRSASMWQCIKISLVVQLAWFVHDSLAFLVASWIPFAEVEFIIQPMLLEDVRRYELLVACMSDICTLSCLELFKFLLEMAVLRPRARLVVGHASGLDVFNDVFNDGRFGDGGVVTD